MVFKLAPLLTFLFQFLWNQTTIIFFLFSFGSSKNCGFYNYKHFIGPIYTLNVLKLHIQDSYWMQKYSYFYPWLCPSCKVLWFCGRGTLPVWAWPTIFFSSKYKVDFFLFCFLHLFLQDILNHIWQKKLRSVVLNYTLFLGSFVCREYWFWQNKVVFCKNLKFAGSTILQEVGTFHTIFDFSYLNHK